MFKLACILLIEIMSSIQLLPLTTGAMSIQGSVLADDGTAVVDATVYFDLTDRPATARPPHVVTDNNGAFYMSVPNPGTYSIRVAKPDAGYPDSMFAFNAPDQSVSRVKVPAGQNVAGIVITLGPKSGMIHVHVIDAKSEQLLEGVTYRLCQASQPQYCIDGSAPAEYDFSVPPKEISIEIAAKGYMPIKYVEKGRSVIRLGSGEQRTLIVRLMPLVDPNKK